MRTRNPIVRIRFIMDKVEEKKPDFSVKYLSFDNHKLPEYKEVRGKEWVYYGNDNLYPNYLLELLARCGKHNAIVQSKATYVAGGGWESENKSTEKFIKNDLSIDNAGDIFFKTELDYEIFTGYAIGVTWSVNKKNISAYQHIDFGKLRESKCGKIILYCEDWSDGRLVRSIGGVKKYPKFDAKTPGGFQIIYYKEYFPYYKKLAYPIPSYLGSITSIETDVEVGNFHLNNIKNGYSGGTVFIFKNGEPVAEKKREIEAQLKKKHSGTDKAGGMIVIYANRTEDAAEIKNINPSDLDKQFAQLRENATQEIYIGHQITSPILFGIKEPGQLGGRNELIEAFELFNNSYVSKRQKMFEKQFNELAVLFGVSDPKLKAKKVRPLNLDVTNTAISAVMSTDEIRESLMLSALPKNDEVSQGLIDTVNLLNPKVAAAVLASFTTNELRLLANLPPITGGDTIPAPKQTNTPQQMSSNNDEKKFMSLFKNCGEGFDLFEEYKEEFSENLGPDQNKVLGILKANPNATAIEISKALNTTPRSAQEILDGLENNKIITVENKDGQTTTTINETADTNKIRPIQVRYKYQAKTGPDIISTTRPVCKFLIEENKLYTREEIDQISEQIGFSAWNYRGGWYHQDNGENTPYCRHIWRQVNVIKK